MWGARMIASEAKSERCGLPISYAEIDERVCAELSRRKSRFPHFGYADSRGARPDLYGTTGAINCFAILGRSLGSLRQRARWSRAVLKHQRRDGSFSGRMGPEHALGMAIQSLNILGTPIPENISPLAPTKPADFRRFLEVLDWTTTHKPLWGLATPLVAGNRISKEWMHVLDGYLRERSKEEKARIYKTNEDQKFKVISSIYHIFAIYDAGKVPYPDSYEVLSTLLELDWHENRGNEERTQCSDGDWAWLLMELCKMHPELTCDALRQIESVCEQRCNEWNAGLVEIESLSTHHIYCYLWVVARFQSIMRHSVVGGMLWDTLNSPQLFRI